MKSSIQKRRADVKRKQSAGEFLAQMAVEIKDWLHDNTLAGATPGMQWLLTATLPDGTRIIVHQASASGNAMIKLTGELADGRPALLISHLNAVQF